MTGAIHAPVISSARRLQHVLQKNAIALSGVVHQNMRYSAYKFTVLDNGTAAHGCVKIGTTFFLKYLLYGLLFKADFGESHESGKLVREIPFDTDAFVRSNDNPFNKFLCKLRCQFYQSLIRGNLFDS